MSVLFAYVDKFLRCYVATLWSELRGGRVLSHFLKTPRVVRALQREGELTSLINPTKRKIVLVLREVNLTFRSVKEIVFIVL